MGPGVTLDIDMENGRGPETMSMNMLHPGYYHYYVKCFSCYPGMHGTGALTGAFEEKSAEEHEFADRSEASLTIFENGKQKVLKTREGKRVMMYKVDRDATGTKTGIWDVGVFYVSKSQKVSFTPHLRFIKSEPGYKAESLGAKSAHRAALVGGKPKPAAAAATPNPRPGGESPADKSEAAGAKLLKAAIKKADKKLTP